MSKLSSVIEVWGKKRTRGVGDTGTRRERGRKEIIKYALGVFFPRVTASPRLRVLVTV
ncbi:hypothetical protein [Nostoc linckia]|uniref:hypothetical protein n=1 Tax=Nostoc linckia TaxID=92942 RepID=UPI0015D51945|nr:hypothetical protein [Nostoc linckia]